MSKAFKCFLWFELSKPSGVSDLDSDISLSRKMTSSERLTLPHPPDPPDPPPPLRTSSAVDIGSFYPDCYCLKGPMYRRGPPKTAPFSPSMGFISPDRKVSLVSLEARLLPTTASPTTPPTLFFSLVLFFAFCFSLFESLSAWEEVCSSSIVESGFL